MKTEREQLAEYTRKNGEVMTICEVDKGYEVDQWGVSGINRWHKFYFTKEDAMHEFERWRD